jgi:tetratricopeptide (TPR) repeat protein
MAKPRYAGLGVIAAAFVATLAGCQSTPSGARGESYYDLGGFHRAVTTRSDEAQLWFDRGLVHCYGFNHEEAIRCFERAVEADPDCAMAQWGIAYASGPNINNLEMDEAASRRAWDAIQAARRATGASEVECDLVDALATRYAWPAPADRSDLDRVYAEAMRRVHATYPDDADVTAIFAESLMVLRPWKLWSPAGEPAPETPEIVATLESGLALVPDHPALCHFYIHTMEASQEPELALPAADRLRNKVPGSSHLVHMPSHIDIRLGHYREAIVVNQKAVKVDREVIERQGVHNFYTLYRLHNYHFLVYGAMFDGRYELALDASRELVRHIPEDLLREWVDYLDAFVPTPLHVMVRFGRWEEILEEPAPAPGLPMTLATWHYARGVAFAATGRVVEADRELRAFYDARDAVPETSILFNNTSTDILAIAEAMLEGELAYRRGNYDTAFAHLKDAVRRDDALNYDEPWGWMQPARHALGALLLEQGRVEEAEAVYRADLYRHPNNLWALHGLAECLELQGRNDEAETVSGRYREMAARCDVNVNASCYCRLNAAP